MSWTAFFFLMLFAVAGIIVMAVFSLGVVRSANDNEPNEHFYDDDDFDRSRHYDRWLCLALIAGLAFSSSLALAHSWYPKDCCSGQDCQPVACDDLEERSDGSIVERNVRWVFSRDKVRPSPDSSCHICVAYRQPRCVFVVQGS